MKKAILCGLYILATIVSVVVLIGGCAAARAASRPQEVNCHVVVPLDLKGNVSWSPECGEEHFAAIIKVVEGGY